MMNVFYCAIVVAVGFVTVLADKNVTVGDITTMVKGQSGKIAVYRGENETNGIVITYDAIKEMADASAQINSHTFQTFASQEFTFSDLVETTYQDSNVSVTQFNFTATLSLKSGEKASLTSHVFVFTEDGNITVDGEDFNVSAGMMKFNVYVESWPFCNTCKQGNKDVTGAFLDVHIEIKGKSAPSKAGNSGKYDLGDGASVVVPKQVIYDGKTTEEMPSGYPMLEQRGAKSIFIFRFKKFDTSALYDPTVDLGNNTDTDPTDPTPTPGEEEKDLEYGEVVAKVKGQSGKIHLSRKNDQADSGKGITVEFDNLKEKKQNGDQVKDNKHAFNGFANQQFKFTGPMNAKYPDSDLDVAKLTFQATLTNEAVLKIDMYIFKQDGNITQEDETRDVKTGNMKFNVDISNWKFCDGTNMCTQSETGDFLDFEIVMKGSKGAKKKGQGNETEYDLGSGNVWLSRKVKKDGQIVDMESGYPMLRTQGSKDIFQFRFHKFNQAVMYDPVVTLGAAEGPIGAATVTLSSLMTLLVCFVVSKLL